MDLDPTSDSIRVNFGEFGSRVIKVTKNWNGALGFSVEARRNFSQLSEFSGSVEYLTAALDVKRKLSFRVVHKLGTSSPLVDAVKYEGKLVTNGVNEGKKCCYPEALYFNDGNFSLFTGVKSVHQKRPFAWYSPAIIQTDDAIIIYGPDWSIEEDIIYAVKTKSGEYPVFVSGVKAREDQVVRPNEPEVTSIDGKSTGLTRCNVYLNYDGRRELYVLNQGELKLLGTVVPYDVMYDIICIAVKHELNGEGDADIYLIRNGDEYRLSHESLDEYYESRLDSRVMDVMSLYDHDDSGIYLRNPRAAFIRRASKSCHALCLSMYFATLMDLSYTSMLYTCPSLIKSGVLKNDEGVLTGYTGTLDGNKNIRLVTYGMACELKGVNRTVYTSLKDIPDDLHTLAVLGCDPFAYNSVEGQPDHWVVVNVHGKHLEVVYDPYRNYDFMKIGSDVSSMLDMTESKMYVYDWKDITFVKEV